MGWEGSETDIASEDLRDEEPGPGAPLRWESGAGDAEVRDWLGREIMVVADRFGPFCSAMDTVRVLPMWVV